MSVEGWVTIITTLATAITGIILALQGRQETKALKQSMQARGILPSTE